MARVTQFSIGRRWRCARGDRIAFDFVIIGPGRTAWTKRCRTEPLPGQEKLFGEQRIKDFVCEQDYSHRHLKSCATLVPLSLDDIVAAAQ